MNYIEQVQIAARNGKLEEWLHTFLLAEGKNPELSFGLKKQKRFWVGPVELPLSKMPRIVGYESNKEYVKDVKSWNEKVERLARDIQTGWVPPPLIAEYRNGELSLRDGNHRHGALETLGYKSYWTLVWFNSKEDLEAWDRK